MNKPTQYIIKNSIQIEYECLAVNEAEAYAQYEKELEALENSTDFKLKPQQPKISEEN